MFTLILLILLATAVCFGVFFVVFKLIWVLFKKSSNRWPLILAGVTTALIWLLLGIATYRLYHRFVTPLQPIMTAIQTQKVPVYKQDVYTDTAHGFSIAQYDGMTFSNWINIYPASMLVGVDTNAFLSPQKDNMANLSGIMIVQVDQARNLTAVDQLQQVKHHIEQNTLDNVTVTWKTEPQETAIAGADSAAYAVTEISSLEKPISMPVTILAVRKGNSAYIVFTTANRATETALSFQLLPTAN